MTKLFDRTLRRFGYVHKSRMPMPEYTISYHMPMRHGDPSSISITGTLRSGQRVHGDLHRI